MQLLRRRGELSPELAEPLLTDADAGVRFEALQALTDNGRSFSGDDARRILVKPISRGLFAVAGGAPSDPEGERNWTQFRARQMAKMTDVELDNEAAANPVTDQDARFVLDERHFSERGDKLRAAVADRFKKEFADSVRGWEPKVAADTLQRLKSLEEYVTLQLTRKGLSIISRRSEARDLELVRKMLAGGVFRYSDEDIEFLKKRGEWEDVRLILTVVEKPDYGTSLFSSNHAKYRTAARAVYAMGRNRFGELVRLEMPPQVLLHIIVDASDKAFRSLTDAQILDLLFSKDDAIRKAASLKCIRSLAKSRTSRIFDAYSSSDRNRFYNVIFWLDMGLSIPREQATRAAERVIQSTWRSKSVDT